MCVVEGVVPLHSLFNFLLEQKNADSSKDVPQLLSAAPFAHCALRPLSLSVGVASREAAQAAGAADAATASQGGSAAAAGAGIAAAGGAASRVVVHTATLSGGHVAPWHISRLLHLFSSTQEGDFCARLWGVHASSADFNSAAAGCAGDGEEDETGDAEDGGTQGDDGGGRRAAAGGRGGYGTAEERAELRRGGGRWWLDGVAEGLSCVVGVFKKDEPGGKR